MEAHGGAKAHFFAMIRTQRVRDDLSSSHWNSLGIPHSIVSVLGSPARTIASTCLQRRPLWQPALVSSWPPARQSPCSAAVTTENAALDPQVAQGSLAFPAELLSLVSVVTDQKVPKASQATGFQVIRVVALMFGIHPRK